MAQAEVIARWESKPWAGTVDRLIQAANLGATKVADAAPPPTDFDPEGWPSNDPEGPESYYEKRRAHEEAKYAREVTIRVAEAGGIQRTLTAVDDLKRIHDDDLPRIESIDIDVGRYSHTPPSTSCRLARRSGLEVKVTGRDRTWATGVRHEVQEILEPRQPWRLHLWQTA